MIQEMMLGHVNTTLKGFRLFDETEYVIWQMYKSRDLAQRPQFISGDKACCSGV